MSRIHSSGPIFILILYLCLLIHLSPEKTFGSDSGEKPYSNLQLFRLGPQRIFKGPYLKEIAFPLGGIGTGTISIGGRGNLRDWEIFNRPGKGVNLPFSFFAIHFKQEGKSPVVRVLEGPLSPPFRENFGHGARREFVPGLPRMEEASFRGLYPKVKIELTDSKLPLSICLEAFNPFIPLDPSASGIPAILVRFRVKNLSSKPVKICIVGSIMNPIGYDGIRDLRGIGGTEFGQNLNQLIKTEHLSGLFFSSKKIPQDSPVYGTMALTSPRREVTYLTHWKRGNWAQERQSFWDDFMDDGLLANLDEASPTPEGRTDMGSLGLPATLEPFEEVDLPFIIAWNFPNLTNYMSDRWFDRFQEEKGKIYKTHYSIRYFDAWDAAEYLEKHLPQLEAQTQRFMDLFFSQTLPPYVLESVSSQVSIIRTPTCFWLENGNFFGYEGCDDSLGCCPLNCSHVWNYAQSLAFLFPSLERSMRETDFLNNVKTDGDMAFRTTLPLGDGRYWNHMPAADGQMGRIISLYRDWQISGDLDFLKNIWPEAKKALEYAWISWDKDKDGIMEGVQHNTYDIEFHGPNSMISSIYLGALLAGFHMAEAVGDGEAAKIYKGIFSKGKKKFEDLLWGDGYYVQNFPGVMDEPFQYGIGCLSDQILGQWFGMVAGLGRFLSEDRVKTALQSVYQHNFVTDFRERSNIQRVFALGNEKGLLVCSWPKGGKPSVPFRYSDEVWTGIEYQVASHLIYENFIEEGLSIVKAIRERYDGRKRNPWNEEECGSHYVRAMASWGVLTALTGYSYSGPRKKISFDPKVHHEKFKCFWSCGSGWGSFSQESEKNKREKIEILVEFGSLKLKQFTFHLPPSLKGKKIVSLEAFLKNRSLDISFFQETDVIHIKWDNLLSMMAGDTLELKVLF